MNFSCQFLKLAKLPESVLSSDRDKSSVFLCMVQRNICQCIIRTSSLALACCLEYPQMCFTSAHLSGSLWALRWPWLPQRCSTWVPREGTVSLPARTLPLPGLLLPSPSSFPLALKQSWLHPGSVSLARVQLPLPFWISCMPVHLDALESWKGEWVINFPSQELSIQSSQDFAELIFLCTLVSPCKN